jgi:hypothetical protein
MLIEQYLPTFDVRDYREVRVVAPAETAYAVLRSLDLQRSWIVQALFAIRSLPSRLRGSTSPPPPSGTFLEQALAVGWVILAEAPGRELVAGAVTHPWRPVVTFQGLPPAEFLSFTTPGFTKIVWAIAARPVTPNVSVLSMETRVLATDPASRRKFRLYWCIVSPGVRLLRRIALNRTRRELERARQVS